MDLFKVFDAILAAEQIEHQNQDTEFRKIRGFLFSWNKKKYRDSFAKHKIKFEEAALVFFDKYADISPDVKHRSDNEDRWIAIGLADSINNILYVSYVERVLINGTPVTRIYSARRALKKEVAMYEQQKSYRIKNKE
jgi:uncharacterized DUF497 family protein